MYAIRGCDKKRCVPRGRREGQIFWAPQSKMRTNLCILALASATIYAAAQTGPTGASEELEFTVFNATNSTLDCSGCGQAWIGTIVSAGLFIVSEALPFISKSPSNGIIHTLVNGLKGTQKK